MFSILFSYVRLLYPEVRPREGLEFGVSFKCSDTDAGTNINLIVGSGSTATGLSANKLDSSTSGTSNALQLRLHNVCPRVGNALGDYAEWVVSINLSDDLATTGVS